MSAINDDFGIHVIETIQKSSLSREAQILDLGDDEITMIRKILKSTNKIASHLEMPICDVPSSIYASNRLELLKWRLLLNRIEKILGSFRYIIRLKNRFRSMRRN